MKYSQGKNLRRDNVELFDLLPVMESVNPRNGYGLVWHEDYRGHWRKFKWKNSKPKWKK